jgi:hypothetical protein
METEHLALKERIYQPSAARVPDRTPPGRSPRRRLTSPTCSLETLAHHILRDSITPMENLLQSSTNEEEWCNEERRGFEKTREMFAL